MPFNFDWIWHRHKPLAWATFSALLILICISISPPHSFYVVLSSLPGLSSPRSFHCSVSLCCCAAFFRVRPFQSQSLSQSVIQLWERISFCLPSPSPPESLLVASCTFAACVLCALSPPLFSRCLTVFVSLLFPLLPSPSHRQGSFRHLAAPLLQLLYPPFLLIPSLFRRTLQSALDPTICPAPRPLPHSPSTPLASSNATLLLAAFILFTHCYR